MAYFSVGMPLHQRIPSIPVLPSSIFHSTMSSKSESADLQELRTHVMRNLTSLRILRHCIDFTAHAYLQLFVVKRQVSSATEVVTALAVRVHLRCVRNVEKAQPSKESVILKLKKTGDATRSDSQTVPQSPVAIENSAV